MNIRVRYFAVSREITGCELEDLELAPRATTEDLWVLLLERHPRLAPHRAHSRLALNMQYLNRAADLNNGDEVSLIPPVNGG